MTTYHIIELRRGIYYKRESAAVDGFIPTTEPLRASWVNPERANQDTIPRLLKAYPKARVVSIDVTYELHLE